MNATPYAASRIRAIRPHSGPLSRPRPTLLYAPHRAEDDAAGEPGETLLGQAASQPTTHRPWNIRLGRWVVCQLNATGLFPILEKYAAQPLPVEAVSPSRRLAFSGQEEIGAISRYAVEKFISALASVQTLPWAAETPALSAEAWVQPIERLTGEYQQAMLATLDETGRQITAALHAGQPPSPLADEGRSRMDRLSEFYVNTCRTICQVRN